MRSDDGAGRETGMVPGEEQVWRRARNGYGTVRKCMAPVEVWVWRQARLRDGAGRGMWMAPGEERA